MARLEPVRIAEAWSEYVTIAHVTFGECDWESLGLRHFGRTPQLPSLLRGTIEARRGIEREQILGHSAARVGVRPSCQVWVRRVSEVGRPPWTTATSAIPRHYNKMGG